LIHGKNVMRERDHQTGKQGWHRLGDPGGGQSANASKSKQTRKTDRRKYGNDWNRMSSKLKKQAKSGGTFAAVPRAKCLDALPLGFVRPKAGDLMHCHRNVCHRNFGCIATGWDKNQREASPFLDVSELPTNRAV
jgi:hypothetical protein